MSEIDEVDRDAFDEEAFQYASWESLPSSMTINEISVVLRLDPDTVRKVVTMGELPARKVGHQWRVSRDALIRWFSSTNLMIMVPHEDLESLQAVASAADALVLARPAYREGPEAQGFNRLREAVEAERARKRKR